MADNRFFTYILRCCDDTFYCGYTTDLERRLKVHNSGKGGKYTRARIPVELVYYEEASSKSQAMSREFEIKQLSRKQKQELINSVHVMRRPD